MTEDRYHRMKDVRDVLLISLSCIGDVLLTTPVMRVLKDSFPGSRLTVLAGKTSHALVRAHALVDRALVFDNKGAHHGTAGKIKLVRALRQDMYDLVVDLRNSVIPYFLRARYRITSQQAHLKNRTSVGRHAIDRHLDVLELQGFPITTRAMSVTVPEDTAARAREMMNAQGCGAARPLIGVYPGAGSPYKLYPTDQFRKALAELARRWPDARFVIVGGPDDAPHAADVARACPERAVDLSAKLDILETAAAINRCTVFLSNDSGPMHIAAALDVPTIALFGPTDADRYGPRGAQHRIIWRREQCNPCKFPECGHDTCIDRIPPEQITTATNELLERILSKSTS